MRFHLRLLMTIVGLMLAGATGFGLRMATEHSAPTSAHVMQALVYCEQQSYEATGHPYRLMLAGWQHGEASGQPICQALEEFPP